MIVQYVSSLTLHNTSKQQETNRLLPSPTISPLPPLHLPQSPTSSSSVLQQHHSELMMNQAVPQQSPPSLASLFLHPHFTSVPHPWTTVSWMNLTAAAAAAAAGGGYGFSSSPPTVGAMDLSAAASIADLRLKAKRHAEELDAVAVAKNVTSIKESSEGPSKD